MNGYFYGVYDMDYISEEVLFEAFERMTTGGIHITYKGALVG